MTSESAHTAAYSSPGDSARDAVNDLYDRAAAPVAADLGWHGAHVRVLPRRTLTDRILRRNPR